MNRRLGRQNSETASAILDGVEQVLQTRGYGAVTSRSVAEAAGVKQQLVYYYFQDIDALLLAAFKRRMARGMERLQQDIRSKRPLRALWNDYSNAVHARLTFEYMALANHHAGIREEAVRYTEETRKLQIDRIREVCAEKGVAADAIMPEAITFLISAIPILMVREVAYGITVTHNEVEALMERFLQAFDA